MRRSSFLPLAVAIAFAGFLLAFPFAVSASGGSAADQPGAYEDGVLLVGFQPGTTAAERDAIEAAVGAIKEKIVGRDTHFLTIPNGAVQATIAWLVNNPLIRYAEPNYLLHADVTPNDPSFGQLWGLKNTGQTVTCSPNCQGPATGTATDDINAPAAWDVSSGNKGNVVGVVDTGVDYTHPDLGANVWSAPSQFTVTIGGKTITCAAGSHGFNAITNTCDPKDDNDHGTHVSGTIGAVGNNGVGVAGVNWDASIMGLKFLDSSGSGSTANAINAIEFAIQAKSAVGANVRVLSNSWGGGGFSQALLDEINKANANNMLFVAAAGNNNRNNDTTASYPSSYAASNIISVAATDDRDQRASFSNYGANSVHLAAPGVDILSTTRSNTYKYFSGTSMATPHVSGTAALVLAACPTLDTAALKNDILSNVDPIASMSGKTTTGGRLDASKAVLACGATPPPITKPAAPTGLTATAGNGQISLSWSASSGASTYNVKQATTSGGPYTTVASPPSASYTNTGLTNGTTYYYVVTAVNSAGESGNSVERSATPQAPVGDFSLSASPTARYIWRGASTTYTISVNRQNGFNGAVDLSVTGLPAGASASFSPASVTGGSSTMSVTAGTTSGSYTLTVSGKSGTLTRSVKVTLYIFSF